MKRIILTGAGGSGGIAFARALKNLEEQFYIVGVDSSKYKLHRAETDKKVLVPSSKDPHYINVLADLVREFDAELLHVQTTAETLVISTARDQLPCRVFLPKHETLVICADKYECYQIWRNAGIKVPENIFLNNVEDLKDAFSRLGPKLWLRFRTGTAGVGSLSTSNFELARAWIEEYNGWGEFLAAVCLEERSVAFESIWKDGELVVAQQRERLYWEHSNRAPSGVTGVTGAGVTVDYPEVTEIALKAIDLVDTHPDGLFGVDFTYDKDGTPNPTEINAGRFMATHGFFTVAGINFALIFVKSAFDEELPNIPNKINPLPTGLAWIRGMDTFPILMALSDVENEAKKLTLHINNLGQ